MKLFNKLFLLTLVSAIAISLVWTKSASADVIPPGANCNALNSGIGRPGDIYHVGDTIHYHITVTVDSPVGIGCLPAQATDIVVTFTSPNGTTVTLPTIPVLNPGESRTLTGADNAALDYVINSADENANHDVTASSHYVGLSHDSKFFNDDAHGTEDISTKVTPTVDVPEFGFIPGVIALLSSGGTFLVLKKRTSK